MEETFGFLEILLDDPPLRITETASGRRSEEGFYILYVDACDDGENDRGLGGILVYTKRGEKWAFTGQAPPWLVAFFIEMDRNCHINQLKTVVLLAGILTFQDLLQGERLLCFSDSVTALVAIIYEWPKKSEMSDGANRW